MKVDTVSNVPKYLGDETSMLTRLGIPTTRTTTRRWERRGTDERYMLPQLTNNYLRYMKQTTYLAVLNTHIILITISI